MTAMDDQTSHGLASAFESQTFTEDGSFELDKPVGSMSISPCGRDVVLASRQGLHIIDLDTPFAPPRHLGHRTPWEVADVQWSPFSSRDFWVVSTSNQKALVWNLAMPDTQASIEHILHAHTRAITDINFSAHHPDILATCAVDSFVHCWDLRHPARPAMTFCDWFAGATQVKWNRQDSHIIASSHDKFLRIWDDRKGAHPLHSIEAHDTKIYGVDWNRISPTRVVTCSLDKTMKLWDYSNEVHQPEYIIRTPFPVWRARHTPFGSGILAMPQRGNNDLHLYDQNLREHMKQVGTDTPVYRFEGHRDQVKEFLWRPRGTIENGIDNREFQLVSWGADHILRLHRVDEHILATVGHEKGKVVHGNLNLSRRDATYKSFRDHPLKRENLIRSGGLTPDSAEQSVPSQSGIRSGLSLGMSKARIPESVDWVNGAFMSSRQNMSSKMVERKDIDPIAWMKGVKIGKRELGLHQSTTSSMSLIHKSAKHWEPFESLGEEISHVRDKLGKIAFQVVDVRNRDLKISLLGPWGKDQAAVYLQCRLSFPMGYPETATPTLEIGRTTLIDTTTLATIDMEVQLIAHAYVLYQRGSLEAILRYLQGEYAANEIILWTKEDQEQSIIEKLDRGEASSSDEEDDENSYHRPQTDEAGLNGSGLISAGMTNANVPLPKACGALWANNGCLVCFFPRKEDVTQSVLGSLGFTNSEAVSKGHDNLFAGFGKPHNNSPARKVKAHTLETIKGGESDSDATNSDSEDSYFSSSNSSDSSDESVSPHPRSAPLGLCGWRSKTSLDTRIESILDESRESSSSVNQSKLGIDISKTVVSIHDLQSLLLVKQELAQAYQVSGPDTCEYNRKVAEDQGLQDIADAWLILSMILRDEVPVLDVPQKGSESRTWLVAPRTLQALKDRDSSKATAPSGKRFPVIPSSSMTIKWGQHPLGGAGLIGHLFSYFEQLGDVQMVAMILGILSDSGIPDFPQMKSSSIGSSTAEWSIFQENLGRQEMDYFPFSEVAESLRQPTTPLISIPQTSGKSKLDSSSVASSLGASNSDSIPPFSTGVTPPTNYSVGRRTLERVDSNSQSLSASPEQLRHTHRSNSNLATAFASFSKPFSFNASASPSPPTALPRKRFSPNESYIASSDTSQVPGGVGYSFNKTHLLDTNKESKFKITLKNQDIFHNEGYAKVSLLDKVVQWQCFAYTDAYAYMLMMWQMPMVKTKILKQNNKPTRLRSVSRKLRDDYRASLISIGRKTLKNEKNVDFRATLDVRRRCTRCGKANTFNALMGIFKCKICAWKETPSSCIFCDERIRGYVNPCLICGHVAHSNCRSQLSIDNVDIGQDMSFDSACISGCGCQCGEFDVPTVELPEGPPPKSSSPSTIKENDQEEQGWQNEDTWEDVAYESLAKNLAGARHVKPKASRIWRGLERKQSDRG